MACLLIAHSAPPAAAAFAQAYSGLGASTSKRGEITLNGSGMDGRMQHADYYTHTEETKAFQQEFELAKQRQDQQLENIEKGLATLKGAGRRGRAGPGRGRRGRGRVGCG